MPGRVAAGFGVGGCSTKTKQRVLIRRRSAPGGASGPALRASGGVESARRVVGGAIAGTDTRVFPSGRPVRESRIPASDALFRDNDQVMSLRRRRRSQNLQTQGFRGEYRPTSGMVGCSGADEACCLRFLQGGARSTDRAPGEGGRGGEGTSTRSMPEQPSPLGACDGGVSHREPLITDCLCVLIEHSTLQ